MEEHRYSSVVMIMKLISRCETMVIASCGGQFDLVTIRSTAVQSYCKEHIKAQP